MQANRELDVDKQIRDLRFDIERSIRYHARRESFFESFDKIVNVLNLISGSSTLVVFLSPKAPGWLVAVLGVFVAVISFANLSMKSAEYASKHASFRQRYYDLLKSIGRLDSASATFSTDVKKCTEARLDIEREEPPTNCAVDLLAYNDQARALGKGDDCMYAVPTLIAWTANWWRYETAQMETLEVVKRRRESEKNPRWKIWIARLFSIKQ